jgi:hypothetical protein
MAQKLLNELLQSLCVCLPCASLCYVAFISLRRDYCSSDIKNDAVRAIVEAELCPSEMDNDEEVKVELAYLPPSPSDIRLLFVS